MDTKALAALAQEATDKVNALRAALGSAIPTESARLFIVDLRVGADEPIDIAAWPQHFEGPVSSCVLTLVDYETDDQRDNPGGGPYAVWHDLTLMVHVVAGEAARVGEPKDWSTSDWRDYLPITEEECVEQVEQREAKAPLFLAILDRTDGDGGVHEAVAAALTGKARFQHPDDEPGRLRDTAAHILSEVAAMLEGELMDCEPGDAEGVLRNATAMGRLADHLAKWRE